MKEANIGVRVPVEEKQKLDVHLTTNRQSLRDWVRQQIGKIKASK